MKTKKPSHKLIIEISGGCLTGVHSGLHKQDDVILVDWDNITGKKEKKSYKKFMELADKNVPTIY